MFINCSIVAHPVIGIHDHYAIVINPHPVRTDLYHDFLIVIIGIGRYRADIITTTIEDSKLPIRRTNS